MLASLVRCLHVRVHVFSIHMHTYLSLWNVYNLFINSLLKHNYMFSSIIQFSYFLELMLSSWSVSVLFSSSLLLIPPLGTGAPQKKCFSKCVSCHILRHSFCPSITKRVLCLFSFTVQDCQAPASLRLCLSPVLLNYFPDSLLILSLIDSPRINRLSKVNE